MRRDPFTYALGACVVVLVVGCLLEVFASSHVFAEAGGTDDAYISYRYARNLVEGHGLVFNPGERVEGYSNFLYVLLVAPAFLVASDAAYTWSTIINVACTVAALLLVLRHAGRHYGRAAAVAAGAVFALNPSIWFWASAGLETPVVVLLQLLAFTAVEPLRDRPARGPLAALCIATCLSILLRADGFVLPLLVLAYLFLAGRPRPALVVAGVCAATAGLFLLWRYNYYGELLPNTYHAKVSGPLLLRVKAAAVRLGKLAHMKGMLPCLLVFAFAAVAAAHAALRERSLAALGRAPFGVFFAVGLLGYWLYVGGDNFADRFLLVLYPLAVLVLTRHLGGTLTGRAATYVVTLLVLLPLAPFAQLTWPPYHRKGYDCWATLGRFLARHHPGAVVAVDAAGKIPYYSRLETLDMLGLNDRHVAHLEVRRAVLPGHDKYDVGYVLSHRPELITTWVDADTLHLRWGLLRETYTAAGYRLRYLVYTRPRPVLARPVVDVRGLSPPEVSRLVRAGYGYAVLQRQ